MEKQMVTQQRTKKQIVEEGKRIYAEKLKATAERDHWGQFLVVDVQSGDFEIAKNDAAASLQILKRRPNAVLYGIRIGDEVAYRFGLGRVSKIK
jgi:hypothetical protein